MEKTMMKDHDLLVTLNVKVDQLTQTVKENTDGTMAKLSNLDSRVNALEDLVQRYPPGEYIPRFIKVEQDFHDQILTAKERLRMTAAVSTIITFVLSTIAMTIAIMSGIVKIGG